MKIAFTTKGTTWDAIVDPRFGRAAYFLVYDDDSEAFTVYDNREAAAGEHGAGTKAAQMMYDINPDILITGNGPGKNAALVLEQRDIEIITGAGEMTVKEAYDWAMKKR